MITHEKFKILEYLTKDHQADLNAISEKTGISSEEAEAILKDLRDAQAVENFSITNTGKELLEPYKVDNAIILAAGMATRFVPVSYEIPKGLIKVKGEPMIERQICQLREAGISEIIIVVGYMMEKFLYLGDKYNVKFVVNNEYSYKNTHSSIYAARDYLKNTLILCADNYYPENLFNMYEYRTYYCAVYLPGIGYTERSLVVDEEGLIIDTHKPSKDEWILYGHAYWDKSFSNSFRPILEDYYGREGVENMYWETIWAENLEACPMWIKKCSSEEILEFDSVTELEEYDKDYIIDNNTSIIENICSVLYCDPSEIKDFKTLTAGLNNRSFTFTCKGQKYVYRHPGKNAEGVIDRRKEAFCQRCVRDLGIDNTLVYIDSDRGWKISKFINITSKFDFANIDHVKGLASHLKKLHDANIVTNTKFSYMDEANELIDNIRRMDYDAYMNIMQYKDVMEAISADLESDNWQVSLCHNDIYEPNLLVSGDEINLIDWEFAGDTDIGFDICKLFSVLDAPVEKYEELLALYYNRPVSKEELVHLIGCSTIVYYYWFVWSIYVSKNGTAVSDYMMVWYDKMKKFSELYKKTKED